MKIPSKVTTLVGRVGLKTRAASPQILFVTGVVGVTATVVLACRATLRVEEVLDNHDKEMAVALQSEDAKKARIYANTTLELGKLYGPALICGALSITALAGSHNILVKRNAGLAAAYTAVDRAFKEYRERVRAELGDDREQAIYNDVQVCEIEDGSGKTVKKLLANPYGPYSFWWGRGNKNWEPMPEYNTIFLRQMQNMFNDQLQAQGHLFLNEVLDQLGLDRTTPGAVTGWIKGKGDNYVDLGIFVDEAQERMYDFMTGREDGIWLNFNVDGTIYDQI